MGFQLLEPGGKSQGRWLELGEYSVDVIAALLVPIPWPLA
jgi:hypothetical protein